MSASELAPCDHCKTLCPFCPRVRPDLWPDHEKSIPVVYDSAIAEATARSPAAEQRALMAFAKGCLYRENTSSCGCGVSKCHARLGPSLVDPTAVSIADCVECSSRGLKAQG